MIKLITLEKQIYKMKKFWNGFLEWVIAFIIAILIFVIVSLLLFFVHKLTADQVAIIILSLFLLLCSFLFRGVSRRIMENIRSKRKQVESKFKK